MNGTGDRNINEGNAKPVAEFIAIDMGDTPSVERRKEPLSFLDKKIISAARTNPQANWDGPPPGNGDDTNRNARFQQNYQPGMTGGQPTYTQGRPLQSSSSWGGFRWMSSQIFEDELIFTSSFENQQIRSKFVRRVYTILTVQLLYTFGVSLLCMFVPDVKAVVSKNPILAIVALVVFLVVYITLICCTCARRNFPLNFILLAVFTTAMAYIFGMLSAKTESKIILMCMALTAAFTTAISIAATKTSYDSTQCLPFLYMLSILTIIFGTVVAATATIVNIPILHAVYSILIAFLFTLYLFFDTQMIMGGRRIELSPEEYIYAALTLYVDIMHILMKIIQIYQMFCRH